LFGFFIGLAPTIVSDLHHIPKKLFLDLSLHPVKMKFSSSLKFNQVPEWAPHYISYSHMKKLLYQLEKAIQGTVSAPSTPLRRDIESTPSSPHLPRDLSASFDFSHFHDGPSPLSFKPTQSEANEIFTKALDAELGKIVTFYAVKEKELYHDVDRLEAKILHTEQHEELEDHEESLFGSHIRRDSYTSSTMENHRRSESHSNSIRHSSGHSPAREATSMESSHDNLLSLFETRVGLPNSMLINSVHSDFLPYQLWSSAKYKKTKQKLRKKAIELFVLLSGLKDYADLNYTGFTKILKKYDKVTGYNLRKSYLSTRVNVAYPFTPDTRSKLDEYIERLVGAFARIACDGKLNEAWTELQSNLREHIVWERNTIWRDMIEQERKGAAMSLISVGAGQTHRGWYKTVHLFGKEIKILSLSRESSWFIISTFIFGLVLLLDISFFETAVQHNCFAILIYASMLWSTEALPLFVTSMMIPFLVVILRVLREEITHPDGPSQFIRLTAKATAKKIFSEMFSPVIMLLLGGFALAAALSKHNIAKRMASAVLSRAGSEPKWVILANMFVATFSSMFISNVAAPVLCFSLVQVSNLLLFFCIFIFQSLPISFSVFCLY